MSMWRRLCGLPALPNPRDEVEAKVRAIVTTHVDALSMKKAQRVRRDAYGTIIKDAWEEEMAYFCSTVIDRECDVVTLYALYPKAKGMTAYTPSRLYEDEGSPLWAIIEEEVEDYERRRPISQAIDAETLTGEEYEFACAAVLQASGWDAQVTERGGDQGVDIMAVAEGVRVAIQCKRYAKPVGNKAVQEAIAGQKYADAQFAVVVSNASYTSSAVALATKAHVTLLHHQELPGLHRHLGIPAPSGTQSVEGYSRAVTERESRWGSYLEPLINSMLSPEYEEDTLVIRTAEGLVLQFAGDQEGLFGTVDSRIPQASIEELMSLGWGEPVEPLPFYSQEWESPTEQEILQVAIRSLRILLRGKSDGRLKHELFYGG